MKKLRADNYVCPSESIAPVRLGYLLLFTKYQLATYLCKPLLLQIISSHETSGQYCLSRYPLSKPVAEKQKYVDINYDVQLHSCEYFPNRLISRACHHAAAWRMYHLHKASSIDTWNINFTFLKIPCSIPLKGKNFSFAQRSYYMRLHYTSGCKVTKIYKIVIFR